MKPKNIAAVIVIVIISAVISYLFADKLILGPSNRNDQIPTVGALSTKFTPPDPKYFNQQSIDPTQLITITNNASQAPFNGTQ